MRTVWFAICFSVGVTLMAVSGHLPQSASARGGDPARNFRAADTPADGPLRTIVPAVPAPTSAEPAATPAPAPRPAPNHRPRAESLAPPSKSKDELVEPEERLLAPPPRADQMPAWSARRTPADAGPPAQTPPAEPPALSPRPPDALTDPPPSAERLPKPVAAAGPDRSIWIGWDELRLEAGESRGTGLAYQWRQTGGPTPLIIREPQAEVTTAHGLLADWKPSWASASYRFELTVTDANGEQDTDTVEYTVRPAPTLKLKPAGERRFELRDGYQFPLFALTQTNTESFESIFEIASETELTLTRVGGSPSAVVTARADKGHLYLVTVYAQHGAPSSWTEYLVNTAERVPAILQLTVHWVRPVEPE